MTDEQFELRLLWLLATAEQKRMVLEILQLVRLRQQAGDDTVNRGLGSLNYGQAAGQAGEGGR